MPRNSHTTRAFVRWVIIIAIIVLIIVAIVASSMQSETVEAVAAQRGSISAYIEERARTRLPRIYTVAMPIDGRIEPITLDEGDAVTEGQMLAQVQQDDLVSQVRVAQARVDRLRASIVENNDERLERSMLEEITESLVSIDRAVEAAEAETEASKAREDFHTNDLARKREAAKSGAASPTELEEAELADIENRVAYRTDVLNLRALEAIRRASQVWPRIVQEFIEKKSLTEAVLSHELAEAEASLEVAQRDLERSAIRAPVTGTVLHRAVSHQRMFPAGELLLELGRLDDLEVEVEVLSQDAVDIALGDPVEIFGPTIGHRAIQGTVKRVEPKGFTKISSLGVEQQRVRVIVSFVDDELVRLRDEGRTLGHAYRVRVRIHTDDADDAVLIPRAALFRSAAARWQAFVIRDGRARLVDLTVGILNDEHVQVLNGLEAGDEVILAPETSLSEGDRVKARE